MREALGDLVSTENVDEIKEDEEVVQQSDIPSTGSVAIGEQVPASAQNSFNHKSATTVHKTNMAFSNRYDHVDLRNQRKEIYGRLIKCKMLAKWILKSIKIYIMSIRFSVKN